MFSNRKAAPVPDLGVAAGRYLPSHRKAGHLPLPSTLQSPALIAQRCQRHIKAAEDRISSGVIFRPQCRMECVRNGRRESVHGGLREVQLAR